MQLNRAKGNMTLVWSGEHIQPCDYKMSKRYEGKYNRLPELTYYSNDHEVGLTFTKPQAAQDCHGTPLIISDEGYAIHRSEYDIIKSYRKKREMATTEEIAVGLTAEEIHQFNSMRGLMNYLCPILNNLRLDGTTYARMIMKRNDVMGKWRTPDILEVHYCAKVSLQSIQFRPTTKCTLYIPVFVDLPEFGYTEGFVDPITRIISTLPQSDCRMHSKHYLNNQWGVLEYDMTPNKTRMLQIYELCIQLLKKERNY